MKVKKKKEGKKWKEKFECFCFTTREYTEHRYSIHYPDPIKERKKKNSGTIFFLSPTSLLDQIIREREFSIRYNLWFFFPTTTTTTTITIIKSAKKRKWNEEMVDKKSATYSSWCCLHFFFFYSFVFKIFFLLRFPFYLAPTKQHWSEIFFLFQIELIGIIWPLPNICV